MRNLTFNKQRAKLIDINIPTGASFEAPVGIGEGENCLLYSVLLLQVFDK